MPQPRRCRPLGHAGWGASGDGANLVIDVAELIWEPIAQ